MFGRALHLLLLAALAGVPSYAFGLEHQAPKPRLEIFESDADTHRQNPGSTPELHWENRTACEVIASGCFLAPKAGQRLLNNRRGNLLEAAENPKLRNAIDNLFRKGAKVGDGSTMDAVRFERTTGTLLSPKGHAQKLIDRRGQLMKLRRSPDLSPGDRRIVHELLVDIQDALETPGFP